MKKDWEKYLDKASPYDHEDLEAEYFARKSSGGILGIVILGALLVLSMILLMIKMVFYGL